VGQVFIERIGFTALKGARHLTHDVVDLSGDGPVGDRMFALVDPSRGRVLRTVDNPSLVRACARWEAEAGVLTVDLPGGRIEGVPRPSDQRLTVDYWGRATAVRCLTGPWAQAYSEYLGYEVVLCSSAAGEVVYGASVTVLTTGSMGLLARRLGRVVESERFRSTFLIDTGHCAAQVEDSWIGHELRFGEAIVRVRALVPRCAVVDLDPETGHRNAGVLRELGQYRLNDAGITFGVDAVVTTPGRVRIGDHVDLTNG